MEEARLDLLGDDERREFERHVEACAECRGTLAEAAAFEEILDLARDAGRDRELARRLAERIAVRRGRRRRTAVVFAAAAAVFAAVLLVPALSPRPRGPREPFVLRAGESSELAGGRVAAIARSEIVPREGRSYELREGAARFRVDPGEGEFRVVTPAGIVRVLGTEFEVRIMRKSTAMAGSVAVAVLVTAGAVLFMNDHGQETGRAGDLLVAAPDGPPARYTTEEVEAALLERDRLREETAALREEVARLRAEADAAEEPAPPAPDVPPPPEETSAITSTDWDRLGAAIVSLVEGKDEDVITSLRNSAYLRMRAAVMAKELGLSDPNDVFLHPKVVPHLATGLLGTLVPRLGEEERRAIGEEMGAAARRASRPEDPLAVEKRLAELEFVVRAVDDLRRRLEPEEIERVVAVISSPSADDVTIVGIGGTAREALERSVGNHYAATLMLDDSDRAAVGPAIAGFVAEHLAVRARLVAEHGEEALEQMPRPGAPAEAGGLSAVDRVRADAARLAPQAKAERMMLGALSPAAAERLRARSLTIYLLSGP